MRTGLRTVVSAALALLVAVVWLGGAPLPAGAQESVTVEVSLKNRRFQPAEIRVPAGKRITLRIKNLDSTAAEFESASLRVEKVIAGNGEGIVNVRALQPGRYEFFDDFHKETRGALVVQ